MNSQISARACARYRGAMPQSTRGIAPHRTRQAEWSRSYRARRKAAGHAVAPTPDRIAALDAYRASADAARSAVAPQVVQALSSRDRRTLRAVAALGTDALTLTLGLSTRDAQALAVALRRVYPSDAVRDVVDAACDAAACLYVAALSARMPGPVAVPSRKRDVTSGAWRAARDAAALQREALRRREDTCPHWRSVQWMLGDGG